MSAKKGIWNTMGFTLTLGKIADIPLKLHWSIIPFLLFVPVYAVYNHATISEALVLVVILFFILLSVLLHEFGHAIAARAQGVATHDIVLSLIGGVARLEKIPEEPIEEFKIAIAGPIVNLVIFLLLSILLLLGFQFGAIDINPSWRNIFDPEVFIYRYDPSIPVIILYVLALANMVLFIFNLLPVFPMDGGRILRAFLSSKLGRKRATHIAALLGKVLSVILIIAGIIMYRPIWSIIGIFVFMMADFENKQEVQNHTFKNLKAESILTSLFKEVRMVTPMNKIIQEYFDSDIQNYIVRDHHDKIQGVITMDGINSAMRDKDNMSPAAYFLNNRYAILNIQDNFHQVFHEIITQDKPVALVMDYGVVKGIIEKKDVESYFKKN